MKNSVWPILEGYVNEIRDQYKLDLSQVQDEEHVQELQSEIDVMQDELIGACNRIKEAIAKRDSKTVNDYLSYIDHEPRAAYMKMMHLLSQEEKSGSLGVFKPSDLWTGMQRNTPFGKRPPKPVDDEE